MIYNFNFLIGLDLRSWFSCNFLQHKTVVFMCPKKEVGSQQKVFCLELLVCYCPLTQGSYSGEIKRLIWWKVNHPGNETLVCLQVIHFKRFRSHSSMWVLEVRAWVELHRGLFRFGLSLHKAGWVYFLLIMRFYVRFFVFSSFFVFDFPSVTIEDMQRAAKPLLFIIGSVWIVL